MTGRPGPARGAARPHGGFADGAVDWGVRRTYREYVTGPAAHGRWTLTDGARDGGALFRFPRGKGSYDTERRTLDASFTGTLRFTGARLDLALSAVTVTIRDGRGTLAADVTADGGRTARRTPLVTFPVGRLKAEDGLIGVRQAPAKLTEQGAKAFGGMYREGTAMDPVSLAVAVEQGARLPALPDIGSDPAGATPPARALTAQRETGRPSPSATASSPVLPLSLAGAVAVAAVATVFLVRRARR
ncbi:HtaA domain-containing protein [Streptomyces sirii]|uniref:HtaA domain-containing protein n=1 Tax=Streptomyces sirii TaxID=3127701 RepID=UPI003D35EB34